MAHTGLVLIDSLATLTAATGRAGWLTALGVTGPDGIEWLAVVALVFGAIWLSISLYTYAPVYRRAVFRLAGDRTEPHVYRTISDRPTETLPSIDVLVPAYDEDETIGYTIAALRAADYPAEKLTVAVLVEASDRTTRRALSALGATDDFETVVIPPDYPGEHNKPRALTYGFERTDGDIVGVVDAEDIVAPDLFGQVVAAIVDDGYDYAQGRLDMANEGDGLLNTLFRGEYGLQYRTIVPGYRSVGYPVPLGGTTNFVTRETLEAVAAERVDRFGSPWTPAEREQLVAGGYRGAVPWDPRNVTEDFELGLLLWEMDRKLALLTAVTREESPIGLNEWLKQRTRWQKGKLFTLGKRLRQPPAGLRGKLHVYAQSATPHLGPINTAGVILVALYSTFVGFEPTPIVTVVLLTGFALAIQQLVIHAIGYWMVTDSHGVRRVGRTLLNVAGGPLYWVLQWGADIRAFMQLAVGNLGWEKTAHEGRHVTDETPKTKEATDLRFVVSETDDGWTWRGERVDRVVIDSARSYPSLEAAERAVTRIVESLAVASAPEATFEIAAAGDAWRWRLVDTVEERALAVEPLTDGATTIQQAGRVKTAAGIATVRSASTAVPTRTADTEDETEIGTAIP